MSSTNRGHSYKDPIYDQIEAKLEKKYGLPAGGMRAIRTRGERSNANQVSPVGARTVYQIMPNTRRLFQNKYKVDAYSGIEGAAEVAALHLKESMDRNGGNWTAAVGEYHGGTNRRNWGPVNAAYRARVTGTAGSAGSGAAGTPAPVASSEPAPRPKVPTVEELLGSTPEELFGEVEAELKARRRARSPSAPSVKDLTKAALTGGDGITVAPLDHTPVGAERELEAAARADTAEAERVGHWDRFTAAFDETLTGELIDTLGEQHQEFDPAFQREYLKNWQQIESFAQTDGEVAMLRDAKNPAHLLAIKQKIEEDRETQRVINTASSPTALMIGTGILDPAGWLAGFGVGKAMQVAGVGSRALAIAGRPVAAVASGAVEGAVGNLAVTAGLDAAGDYVTPAEYGMSALTGLAIGAAIGGLTAKFAKPDAAPAEPFDGDGYVETWQGSPVNEPFDAHRWDKLGSGEGNHAQGKGHYTAENQAIGAWYWDQLTRAADEVSPSQAEHADSATTSLLRGLRINPGEVVGFPASDGVREAQGIFSKVATMARVKAVGWLRSTAKTAMDAIGLQRGVTGWELGRLKYRALVSGRLADEIDAAVLAEKGGSVYKVRIRKGDYLDWDRPLAEQSDSIKARVREAGYDGPDTVTGEEVYKALGDPETASTRLRDAGIRGNTYENGLARAGKAPREGNMNYVSFADEDMSIAAHWTPQGGWVNRAAPNDFGAAEAIQRATRARAAYISSAREAAARENPDATPEQLNAAVNDKIAKDYLKVIDYALADIPENQRIMVAEDILTQDEAFQRSVSEANDLESVSDITERAMVAETVARSERLVGATQIDEKALKTVLAKLGQEATSTRLLLSKSPVAKAVAITLLENPQGAAGRQRSAAITAFMRERVYNEQLSGFDALATQFRRKEGITLARDAWDGTARNQFNRRVFREIEGRGSEGHVPDSNPFIVEAADKFQAGMEKMRLEQQKVGTVGHMRLGDNSVGYVPHRLDPRKVLGLTGEQTKQVRATLAGQFQEIEGFDAAFSEQLASKYLERAVDAAAGRYHVPFNLHSPEAGQIVRDALEAMGMAGDELEKLMGKFSRGGAGHTKRRLRLDLDADIGDGMKLMDLFVTDIPALYRSYARRVAGEVSLAQYGVMGKKGLTVLSKAMTATGATPEEIKAFDQIAAEFLNTPFGRQQGSEYKWMDNVRMAASASRLGGMAFTQFAEFGNAIPALGVQAAIRSIGNMPRMMADVRAMVAGGATPNPILKSIDQMGGGVAMDEYHMTRMFDVRDNEIQLYGESSLGVVSRAIRAGAHANMILSGHRMMVAAQTRSMAEEILRKAVSYAKSGKADIALDDMGIHQGLRDAIRADLDKIAKFDGKGRLIELDLFKGEALTPPMVNELAQSVERGAAQIIQRTFHGETGHWAHSDFIKLLAQFRTFSITAVEKQWGRNIRNYGAAKSFMYLMAAASFALPIHLARMQTRMLSLPADKREKYWEQNSGNLALTRATLNYASSAGLSGDIMDMGASVFSAYGGDLGESLGDSYGIRGKRSDQFFGGVVAPGAGVVDDVWSGLFAGDPHRIVRSLPGSNLPYVTPFINAAMEGLEDD